jgi:hypothetical protein
MQVKESQSGLPLPTPYNLGVDGDQSGRKVQVYRMDFTDPAGKVRGQATTFERKVRGHSP